MNQITTCPHCSQCIRVSEQITDKRLICPRCLADVDNPEAGSEIQAADLDTDVKQGLSRGSIVLAVLIGLCVVGIVIALLRFHDPFNALTLLLVSSTALAVLLIIAIIRWMVRRSRAGNGGSIVTGALGIAFIIVCLVCVTLVAAFLFLYFTCQGIMDSLGGGH